MNHWNTTKPLWGWNFSKPFLTLLWRWKALCLLLNLFLYQNPPFSLLGDFFPSLLELSISLATFAGFKHQIYQEAKTSAIGRAGYFNQTFVVLLNHACHTLRFWGFDFFFSNTSSDDQNKKINLIKDLAVPIPDSDSSYLSSLALFWRKEGR